MSYTWFIYIPLTAFAIGIVSGVITVQRFPVFHKLLFWLTLAGLLGVAVMVLIALAQSDSGFTSMFVTTPMLLVMGAPVLGLCLGLFLSRYIPEKTGWILACIAVLAALGLFLMERAHIADTERASKSLQEGSLLAEIGDQHVVLRPYIHLSLETENGERIDLRNAIALRDIDPGSGPISARRLRIHVEGARRVEIFVAGSAPDVSDRYLVPEATSLSGALLLCAADASPRMCHLAEKIDDNLGLHVEYEVDPALGPDGTAVALLKNARKIWESSLKSQS